MVKIGNLVPNQALRYQEITYHPPLKQPNGKVVTKSITKETVQPHSSSLSRFAGWIFQKGYEYELVPGRWTTKVLINGREIAAKTFLVTNTPKQPRREQHTGRRTKVTTVTRDNFINLTYLTAGGAANIKRQFLIRNNRDQSYGSLGPGWTYQEWQGKNQVMARFGALTETEFQEIIHLLNKIRFSTLSGKYHQKGLTNGSHEKVILILLGTDEEDEKFQIENYGSAAPQLYYQLVKHLDQRINQVKAEPEPEVYGSPVRP